MSFCTAENLYYEARDHGLLSQWRYYGRRGGYALVFDTAGLVDLMNRETSVWKYRLSLGEVGYSCDPDYVLNDKIDSIPALLNAFKNCNFSSEESAQPLLEPFMDCCIHYKHWAFSEENEVRLVATLNGPKMIREHEIAGEPIREPRGHTFRRETPDIDIPCLYLFEEINTDRSNRLPICRIIVGPGDDQSERETELKQYLSANNIPIETFCSQIPIRF